MTQNKKKTKAANPQAQNELVLTIPTKQAQTKEQQTFNRLVKKIERLQKDITDTDGILTQKLDYYTQHIYPLEKETVELRKTATKLIFPFYVAKKPFAKRDKQIIKTILIKQLNSIFSFDSEEPDAELKEIFEALQGINYEDAEKQDLEEMKQEMTEMFESFGFKVDLNDLTGDLTEEDMVRKMQELEEQLFQGVGNFGNPSKPRKKTKKQLEKEAREKQIAEVKNKSIGRIYKQLAKVLHPDLEQDVAKRALKEQHMRELTAAYENKDLHTLLRLELEWIQKEESNLEQLTDEKLKIYNEVLKEQAAELQQEVYMLEEHPRFQALQSYTMFPGQLKFLNVKDIKDDLTAAVKSLSKSIARLQTDEAPEEMKQLVSYFRNR